MAAATKPDRSGDQSPVNPAANPVRSRAAKRTAPTAQPVGPTGVQPTVAEANPTTSAVPDAAVAEADADAVVAGAVVAEEPPLNRAARRARAKGRGRPAPQSTGQAKIAKGTKPVPTPRIWANRRSG